jgi:phage tail tape-measure protein
MSCYGIKDTWELAAQQGYANAMNHLGFMYLLVKVLSSSRTKERLNV